MTDREYLDLTERVPEGKMLIVHKRDVDVVFGPGALVTEEEFSRNNLVPFDALKMMRILNPVVPGDRMILVQRPNQRKLIGPHSRVRATDVLDGREVAYDRNVVLQFINW